MGTVIQLDEKRLWQTAPTETRYGMAVAAQQRQTTLTTLLREACDQITEYRAEYDAEQAEVQTTIDELVDDAHRSTPTPAGG